MKKVFTLAFAVAMMSLAACSGEKKAETAADSLTTTMDSTVTAVGDSVAATADSVMAPADTTKK